MRASIPVTRLAYLIALGAMTFLLAQASAAQSRQVVVPAGTTLTLRLEQEVSTATNRAGNRFQMTLVEPIVVDNVVAAPAGTLLYGVVLRSEGGKKIGKQHLAGTLSDIRIHGRLIPIVSDTVDLEEKAGGGLAMLGGGTLLGGLVGGGTGAAVGAVVGTGTAVITPKKHITIPKGTLAQTHVRVSLVIPR